MNADTQTQTDRYLAGDLNFLFLIIVGCDGPH